MTFANVGSADRLVRLVVGIALIAITFIQGMPLFAFPGLVMLVVGAILAVTAVIKFCPLYSILGLRTAPKSE